MVHIEYLLTGHTGVENIIGFILRSQMDTARLLELWKIEYFCCMLIAVVGLTITTSMLCGWINFDEYRGGKSWM